MLSPPPATMSSPDNRARLSIVLPATDSRSPSRDQVKQHANTASKKGIAPSNGYIPNGVPAKGYTHGASGPRQSQGMGLPLHDVRQVANGVTPQQAHGNLAVRPPRLLNVDEALQYSTFSSIVPFSSDIIPIPNANLPGSQHVLPTQSERQEARKPLDYLNAEMSRYGAQSTIVQQARNHLEAYLDQDEITDFKFREPAKLSTGLGRSNATTNGNRLPKSSSGTLSAFGGIVLNATDLAYRYPTPTSPEHTPQIPRTETDPMQRTKYSQAQQRPPPETLSSQPLSSISQPALAPPNSQAQAVQQQSPVTPIKQIQIHNEGAHLHNLSGFYSDVPISTPISAKTTPMVVLPLPSAAAPYNDFVTCEKPSESPLKRKRGSEATVGVSMQQTRDQRAASDEMLRELQEIVQDILEAEEQSQADGLGQYFVIVNYEDQEVVTLAPAMHVKLEASLRKVIAAGRLAEIPVEHLQRLQRLCEGSLLSATYMELRIEPEWSTDEFADWIQKLEGLDLALRSSRTLTTMMTAGLEEKQLYSEEILLSVLKVIKKVLDACIIPVIEARSSGPSPAVFEAASAHKKMISQLLLDTNKIMILLGKLLAKVEMAETIIIVIEFFATPLLFVENAHSEKDSVLGIQKFEGLRRTAMDLIAIIFSRYPDQRSSLFNEILSSLQKLPVTRQHARQFRLGDGASIQLVSALILRLVQTSATHSESVKRNAEKQSIFASDDEQNSISGSPVKASSRLAEGKSTDDSDDDDDYSQTRCSTTMQVLSEDASFLIDSAATSAHHVVSHLVGRAMTASKTGDQPHRQLLDIFVEDMIAVLNLPEWPAAELMLRLFLASCRRIAENPKSLAPAKNMALELLGQMGSAIAELVSSTRLASRSLENSDSEFNGYLQQMLDDYTDGSLESAEVLMWAGPFHAVTVHLRPNASDDPQTTSAQGYYLARWAKIFSSGEVHPSAKSEEVSLKVRKMLTGADWFIPDSLANLTPGQIRIAYSLTLLTTDFCRQFDYILKILLDSISSEQITVRTRSLKSVTQMLERDPSILDRAKSVKVLINNCATDNSSMVRDSALSLIGKCIVLKPALEAEFLKHVLRLSDDPAAGVRKRSMRMLKDIYLRNEDNSVKTAISDSLLQRVKDLDTGVSDLARQTFEEIWLMPFWGFPELPDASAQEKVALENQTSLIVGTVRRGEKVAAVLVQLLKEVLSNNSKNAASNFRVSKSVVATAFDMTIDNIPDNERPDQRQVLQTLTVFAKANPRLFTSDQLQALQPYTSNLSGKDDLDIFRSSVVMFRCVLPVLPNIQHGLLRDIQKALMQSISKLGKPELDEVAECLWTINGTLQNPESLLRLLISVLKNLRNLKGSAFADANKADDLKRVKKYIQIAGYFGKHCDFEKYGQTFQHSLPWWKGTSVAGLLVESILPFTPVSEPLSLRAEAFDSIGLICQSWPYQYTQERISAAFEDVLKHGEPEVQSIVLSSFRNFFARIDRQAETKSEDLLSDAENPTTGKLGGSMRANDGDGASALIAQRFLIDTLAIALASQDVSALTATEVIASINRQGLVHPKESGPALVALGTSTNPVIARVAFEEHRLLHQQHESMFEREYMRSVQEAFRYQSEIVKDTLGYTKQPYASKLAGMFEIIRTSKGRYQKKFLSNFCARIDFDLSKMDLSGNPPRTLQFSRFLTENLAFFEYGRLDDLLHSIACIEKIVADTGSGVAHAISTEIFNLTVESVSQDAASQSQTATDPITTNPSRLLQLTTAAVILSSLWETRTYLRRLYGQSASQQKREGRAKAAAKDLNKAPSRVQGITGEKLVAAIAENVQSLNDHDAMVQQCKDFVELMSVDNEVKVAADGEEDSERLQTPLSDEEERDTPMSGGSRGLKRKGSYSVASSTAGTPMKKRRGRPPMPKKRKSGRSVDSDEDWD